MVFPAGQAGNEFYDENCSGMTREEQACNTEACPGEERHENNFISLKSQVRFWTTGIC